MMNLCYPERKSTVEDQQFQYSHTFLDVYNSITLKLQCCRATNAELQSVAHLGLWV